MNGPFTLTPSGLFWEINASASTVLRVSVERSRPSVEPRGLDPNIPARSDRSVSSPVSENNQTLWLLLPFQSRKYIDKKFLV